MRFRVVFELQGKYPVLVEAESVGKAIAAARSMTYDISGIGSVIEVKQVEEE